MLPPFWHYIGMIIQLEHLKVQFAKIVHLLNSHSKQKNGSISTKCINCWLNVSTHYIQFQCATWKCAQPLSVWANYFLLVSKRKCWQVWLSVTSVEIPHACTWLALITYQCSPLWVSGKTWVGGFQSPVAHLGSYGRLCRKGKSRLNWQDLEFSDIWSSVCSAGAIVRAELRQLCRNPYPHVYQ